MDIEKLKENILNEAASDIYINKRKLQRKMLSEWLDKLISEVRKEEDLNEAIREMVWMARRYANGRMTGAPSTFNDSYDVIRDKLFKGKDFEMKDPISEIDNWPYARYGDKPVEGRKYINK